MQYPLCGPCNDDLDSAAVREAAIALVLSPKKSTPARRSQLIPHCDAPVSRRDYGVRPPTHLGTERRTGSRARCPVELQMESQPGDFAHAAQQEPLDRSRRASHPRGPWADRCSPRCLTMTKSTVTQQSRCSPSLAPGWQRGSPTRKASMGHRADSRAGRKSSGSRPTCRPNSPRRRLSSIPAEAIWSPSNRAFNASSKSPRVANIVGTRRMMR